MLMSIVLYWGRALSSFEKQDEVPVETRHRSARVKVRTPTPTV